MKQESALSPILVAGPNRRAHIYNTSSDIPFLANWTTGVFSEDIDVIVDAARALAKNQNVFLAGHSAGTGFTARYAASDFDAAGFGPADPGYAKLRGIVLFEGGGGNTTGAPLTSDSLDRMEDKADGGLFAAVRDNAPRCVDGTPCTVATEAVDCAGKGRGRCTEPTTACSAVGGITPAIAAASEPESMRDLLALMLRKALQDPLEAAGHGHLEWAHVIDDLAGLQEIELNVQGKGYRLRTETKGTLAAVFGACRPRAAAHAAADLTAGCA